MDSDEALFERWAKGDMGAFDRLYARFERPLFGFIRAQIGDAAEAEDLLHEAFLAVLRARGGAAALRSFRAGLFEVARNLCRNRARARLRAGRAIDAGAAAGAAAGPPAAADERLGDGQRAAQLERAVERLPQPLAEVYRLRAAGMSYDEVAALLEVPLGTVKSRMHEMIKRLRAEVEVLP
jgi:RNA polymerase sigma-70 factor (ECF subfamily)